MSTEETADIEGKAEETTGSEEKVVDFGEIASSIANHFRNDYAQEEKTETQPEVENKEVETQESEEQTESEDVQSTTPDDQSSGDSDLAGTFVMDGKEYTADEFKTVIDVLEGRGVAGKRFEFFKGLSEDEFDAATDEFNASKQATLKHREAVELNKGTEALFKSIDDTYKDFNEKALKLSDEFKEQFPNEVDLFKKTQSMITKRQEEIDLINSRTHDFMLKSALDLVAVKVPEFKNMGFHEFADAYADKNNPRHLDVRLVESLMSESESAGVLADKLNSHYSKYRKTSDKDAEKQEKKNNNRASNFGFTQTSVAAKKPKPEQKSDQSQFDANSLFQPKGEVTQTQKDLRRVLSG